MFLAVLSDFLSQLSIEDPAYAPSKYKDMFYVKASRGDDGDLSRPLGIADPLGIIHGLCESIELLWESRRVLRLVRFHNFRFSGPGLLQGRESFDSPWETILAYYGDWIFKDDEQGKWVKSDQGTPQKLGTCGSTPLIVGREHLCSTCHKLICQHCGFCSQPCENDGLRESRLPLTKVTASNKIW